MVPSAVWVVLVCAAVAVVTEGTRPAPSAGVLCSRLNCSFFGGCRQPHRVECHLHGVEKVQIAPGTFAQSVRDLVISRAKSVQFLGGALRSLPNLQRLHLSSVDTVELEEDSMSLESSARINVTLERVDRLTVSSGAFSGWGRPGCGVTLREIVQCDIAGGAFRSDTPIQAVTLENVNALSLAPTAFVANITALSFTGVTLKRCPPGTFGGQLVTFSMMSVTLHRAERGCLRADGWDTLTIASSQLDQITTGSFSGDIGDVLLRESTVRRLDRGGIDLNVTRFTAMGCHFGELRQEGLQVTALRSISLLSCEIGTLRQDAFRRLRLEGDDRESIRVSRLRVDRADSGALRFTESAIFDTADSAEDVDGTDKDVNATGGRVILDELQFGMSCSCGARQRARRLLFSTDEDRHRDFHDREHPLLGSVLAARCSDAENGNTSTLAEFELRRCGGDASPSARPVRSGRWYYAAVGVPVLLLLLFLMLAITVTTLRRRQKTWTWLRRSTTKHRTCSASSSGVWVVPPAVNPLSSPVRDTAGGAVQGTAPDTAAGSISDGRVPSPQRPRRDSVTPKPVWVYVRPVSQISDEYESIHEYCSVPLAQEPPSVCHEGSCADGNPNDSDERTSEPPEPESAVEPAAGADFPPVPGLSSCMEPVYDVVRGPPVAVCTCRWRTAGPESVSSGASSKPSVYERPCTCKHRRVRGGEVAQ